MALELYENSLKGVEGKFYVDNVFFVNDDELKDYDKQFPYTVKCN